jgi:predicted ATPase
MEKKVDTAKIRVKTEGFRAINSADIIIDGITVVAGENATGKSTLSKLLYYLYRTAINYDLLVAQSLKNKFRDLRRALEILTREIENVNIREKAKYNLREQLSYLENRFGLYPLSEQDREQWLSIITDIVEAYSDKRKMLEKEKLFPSYDSKRLRYILGDLLNEKSEDKDIDSEDKPIPWEKMISLVDSLFKEGFGKMKSRPVSLLNESFARIFRGGIPNIFEVYEFDEKIASSDQSNLSIPYSIENTIYIDTPMIIGVRSSPNEYWNDLNELLNKLSDGLQPALLSKQINQEIGGDVALERGQFGQQFVFKREDGTIFNLTDVATGIKAFGIIELLLNNGSLTDKTLLIIDEPESNLHPQWIIEYARLIVLLHKQIGVKFFIASHNPDMVSAIKYISAKEGIEKDVNFYLAKNAPGKAHMYDYELLGNNIDPIFASFNIALDRINQYGS